MNSEILSYYFIKDLVPHILKYDSHFHLLKEIKQGTKLKFNPKLRMIKSGNPYFVYSTETIYKIFEYQQEERIKGMYGKYNPWIRDVKERLNQFKLMKCLNMITEEEYLNICNESFVKV